MLVPNVAGAITVVLLTIAVSWPGECQPVRPRDGALRLVSGRQTTVTEFEAAVTTSMRKAGVIGMAVAILDDGVIVYSNQFGWQDKDAGTRLSDSTVFDAASLSKPVFAHLAMLLVENGRLDLDAPLQRYLPRPLPEYPGLADLAGDKRYEAITARMVLSHTTGLPNLRAETADGRLRLRFDPGSRFAYSGEGIQLLQTVVEHIAGRDLETLARDSLFIPFGMRRTSYVWRSSFTDDAAAPHNEFEWASDRGRPMTARAAGTLRTTARDYAQFISGIIGAKGRRRESVDRMLAPSVRITSQRMFGAGSRPTTGADSTRLSWGLGWGLFESPHGRAFFHTGHASGAQNYVVVYRERGIGIVLLSNSDNFESVAPEIVAAGIGDTHSPFEWLGYEPFDPALRKPVPPRRVAVAVKAAVIAPYAGTYRLDAADFRTHIRVDSARLFASDDGQSWDELFAVSDSVFFFKGRNLTLTFSRDAKGVVTHMTVDIDGKRMLFKREP